MAPKSRHVALGGTIGALCLLFIYLASYLPTSRLFFYGVSSVFCAVMVIESGVKWAWVFYGATALLSLAVIPDKVRVLPYILFFGLYGIIKYHIEGIGNLAVEIALKGLFFIFSAGLSILTYKGLFMGEIKYSLPLWLIGACAAALFYVYDYVYTRFVIYFETKIKGRIK